MALIFLVSSLPSSAIPRLDSLPDLIVKKGGHLIAYALLGSFYLRGLGDKKASGKGLAWFMAVLYAITDELHQSLVPGRSATLIDVGIDALGAAFGVLSSDARRLLYRSISSRSKGEASSGSDGSSSISPNKSR